APPSSGCAPSSGASGTSRSCATATSTASDRRASARCRRSSGRAASRCAIPGFVLRAPKRPCYSHMISDSTSPGRQQMARDEYLFTSESVTEGHPDKIADQVSDAVLDAILGKDPVGRVACETLLTTGLVVVAGEITTSCYVDIPRIARETIKNVGYTRAKFGFDYETCAVIAAIDGQSPDIAMGVDNLGAGDQGLMFGYACTETEELMPLPIMMAHKLVQRLSEVRKRGELNYLRPDGKSQVSVRYVAGKPVSVETVVISTQHSPDVPLDKIREDMIERVILPTVPENLIDRKRVTYHINPTGRFVTGGPMGDTGLTGRKIIVDTYGG